MLDIFVYVIINGNKCDNRIGNLIVLTSSEHAKKHFSKGFNFGVNSTKHNHN